MGTVSVVLLTVFLSPQVWADLEYLHVGKRAVFDIIPAGSSGWGNRVKQPEVFYSLSDFEKELKKRIQEIPSKHVLKKEIQQYFRSKNGKARDVPLKKEWKKDVGRIIRKVQTKWHRTFRVYQ